MKKKSRVLLKTLAWIVAIVVVLVMFRNQAIKSAARVAVQKATGFDLEVGRVHAGLISPTFEINDLKLTNPEDFPEAAAFDIKQAKVNCDLGSLLKDTIHLREVILDVPRIVVVKKEDGETNLKRLSDAGKGEKRTGETGSGGKGEGEGEGERGNGGKGEGHEKPAKKMRIDVLTVRIGTVETHDYSRGGDKPVISTHPLNKDLTLQNVTDLADLGFKVSLAIVSDLGLQAFGDIGKELGKHEGDLDNLGKGLDKAAKSIGDSLGGIFGGKKKQAAPAK